jgi:hypothetical protein
MVPLLTVTSVEESRIKPKQSREKLGYKCPKLQPDFTNLSQIKMLDYMHDCRSRRPKHLMFKQTTRMRKRMIVEQQKLCMRLLGADRFNLNKEQLIEVR